MSTDQPAPEVSVVMSVYNGAAALPRTLESVLTQTGVDFEFIVIDDGSTDGSGAILDDWAARDPRLRVIHQHNTGLTRALIRGCAEARGAFIARQDCGDVSLPGRLAAQAERLREISDLAFVSCAVRYVFWRAAECIELYVADCDSTSLHPSSIIDLTQPHGVRFGPNHHGSVMFRRATYLHVGGYRADFYYGQDWDLWYRLGEVGLYACLPGTLYEASLSPGDISLESGTRQRAIGACSLRALRLRQRGKSESDVLAQARSFHPSKLGKTRRNRAGAAEYFIAECLRRRGKIRLAKELFIECLTKNPLHIKASARLVQTLFSADR
ncbi:MAG: glycosyltransferase family 2 protein [Casimicrobiaceae bacterium]